MGKGANLEEAGLFFFFFFPFLFFPLPCSRCPSHVPESEDGSGGQAGCNPRGYRCWGWHWARDSRAPKLTETAPRACAGSELPWAFTIVPPPPNKGLLSPRWPSGLSAGASRSPWQTHPSGA